MWTADSTSNGCKAPRTIAATFLAKALKPMESVDCDVLIIGAGGAGLRAAIAAKDTFPAGKIIIVTKGEAGKSGVTATACSDRMAFHATLPYTAPDGPDNWKFHAEDIYRLGGYVSDGDLASILARESGQAFEYLDELGVPFAKMGDGRADQFITDGSDYARACYTGPRTANQIEEALLKKVSSLDIEIIEHCMIADLLKYRQRVAGAIGLDEKEQGPEKGLKFFFSKTTILANGGAGEAFAVHVFPPGMTGDGYALAYRAGAHLVNMEFIQIGPASTKTRLNCSGSLMRAVPRFVNEKGEEFLKNNLPAGMTPAEIGNLVFEKGATWPVSREKITHLIDVAMFKEILRGGKVFLDYGTNPEGFRFDDLEPQWRKRYAQEIKCPAHPEKTAVSPFFRLAEINPDSIDWLKEHGIDIEAGERIEIAPCIQHFQGGVKIRKRGDSTLAGLYAAGECAGGQHGANRPGGNALLDGQVFGRISGREAAIEALGMGKNLKAPLAQNFKFPQKISLRGKGLPATEVRTAIQTITSTYASVVRTEAGLIKGIKELERLRRSGISLDAKGLCYALETDNLLDVAEMVLRAALARKESRGPHLFFSGTQEPHPLPSRDPAERKYIVIQNQQGRMVLRKKRPVKLSPHL